MGRHFYIAYDGRAEFTDTDDCAVMEAIGEHFTRRDYNSWRDYDCVLAEYEIEGENTLVNERIIGHWRDGFRALKARCS